MWKILTSFYVRDVNKKPREDDMMVRVVSMNAGYTIVLLTNVISLAKTRTL